MWLLQEHLRLSQSSLIVTRFNSAYVCFYHSVTGLRVGVRYVFTSKSLSGCDKHNLCSLSAVGGNLLTPVG